MTAPARYVMVGGFLGAGKSTALAALGRRLEGEGLRVGLITNDQGAGLVDTLQLKRQGFEVEEIAGGCFCCRFGSLKAAADALDARSRPEVFLGEPVGSCTDLIASVSYPLRRLYGERFAIAPLSVLVDPVRARRILGLEEGRTFSPKVAYIYLKQLEEADVIVINKVDLLDDRSLASLGGALAQRFPRARIEAVSARDGRGLEAWFDHLTTAVAGGGEVMELDYGTYGEGEALLGWLNATARIEDPAGIDANAFLDGLARDIQNRLVTEGGVVAHLKMTLDPVGPLDEVGVISLVREDHVPELSRRLPDPVEEGELVINLRAEADPDVLRQIVTQAVAAQPSLSFEHVESFRPSFPRPTHRDSHG